MFADLGYCKIVPDRPLVTSFTKIDCWCASGPGAICIPFLLKMLHACMKAALFMIKNLILKPRFASGFDCFSNPGQYAQPVYASVSTFVKWEKIICISWVVLRIADFIDVRT